MSALKKKEKTEDYMHCCRYCKNFDRMSGVCFSDELISVNYDEDIEVTDVYINNPDTFYCKAWE